MPDFLSGKRKILGRNKSDGPEKVAIVGGGSWGTALAVLIGNEAMTSAKNVKVSFWVRRQKLAEEIRQTRKNDAYLPGVEIPPSVHVSSSLQDVATDARLLIVAVPSQYLRSVAREIRPYWESRTLVCSASKGIELGSFKRMSEVLHEEIRLPTRNIAVLSGPSHAEEVIAGKATAVVVASTSNAVASRIQSVLSTRTFRIYTSRDVRGVEYGGALKNIISIGAGICDGLQKIDYKGEKIGVGDNTKASLLTRGIEEMARLGLLLGSRKSTFYGLSGWGDLLVTAYSRFGRNRLVGECLALGMSLEEIREKKLRGMVPEGVETAKAVYNLSKMINVEMPITEQIYLVLYEHKDIESAIYDLMSRSPKPEQGYYLRGIPKRVRLALKRGESPVNIPNRNNKK